MNGRREDDKPKLGAPAKWVVSAALALFTWWITRPRAQKSQFTKSLKSGSGCAKGVPALRPARKVSRFSPLTSSPAKDEVSIASWNILADSLATPKRLPWVAPPHLGWKARGPALQQELAAMCADIVCLQEVDANRWGEIQGWLPGYASLLQERGAHGSNHDGEHNNGVSGQQQQQLVLGPQGQGSPSMLLALLWKPRLQLVWAEHRSRALLAEFSVPTAAGGSARLLVANVHLEGSPYRPNDRVNQMRSALQRLAARQEAEGAPPADATLILCGDFNSGASESVYRLLQRGRLEGGTTEAYLPHVEVTKTTINHSFLLHDVYATAGSPVPWTRKAPGSAATIDFVWASIDLEVARVYDPLGGPRGRALAGAAGGPRAGLPCALCPSDHLPLGAVLRLRPLGVDLSGVLGEGEGAVGVGAIEKGSGAAVTAASGAASLGAAATAAEGTRPVGARGRARARAAAAGVKTAASTSGAQDQAGSNVVVSAGSGAAGADLAAATAVPASLQQPGAPHSPVHMPHHVHVHPAPLTQSEEEEETQVANEVGLTAEEGLPMELDIDSGSEAGGIMGGAAAHHHGPCGSGAVSGLESASGSCADLPVAAHAAGAALSRLQHVSSTHC